jgi:cyanate transporter
VRSRWAPVVTALVFVVALNLRPSLTSVGPLLPQISAEEGLSPSAQGLLGALPLLGFALVSSSVHRASRRLGMERAVLAGLVVLIVGIVARSYTGDAGLWIGTAILGGAIAVGNVIVPAIVKRDYPAHVSRATGVYSACIGVAASVSSAVAVPMAITAGWRSALAFWAIPAAIAAVLWLPRCIPAAPVAEVAPDDARSGVTVWKQPMAWYLTGFMGLQSTAFYILITWLPTIETEAGISATRAGAHLFIFQIVGIAAGLAIPTLMRRPESQVGAAITASVPIVVGVLGLLLAPGLAVLWAVIAGLGSGASLVVALSMISLRGRTHHETTQLSGMAQSVGYLVAAAGPVLAGLLAQHTGTARAALVLLTVLALLQTAIAIPAGKDRDRAPA